MMNQDFIGEQLPVRPVASFEFLLSSLYACLYDSCSDSFKEGWAGTELARVWMYLVELEKLFQRWEAFKT